MDRRSFKAVQLHKLISLCIDVNSSFLGSDASLEITEEKKRYQRKKINHRASSPIYANYFIVFYFYLLQMGTCNNGYFHSKKDVTEETWPHFLNHTEMIQTT